MDSLLGQTISHYRIAARLGSGGMGVVYEAQDLDLGRKVALKFLPPQRSHDQTALDRFLLEARTASALNHPNICTIYAVEKVQIEGGEAQSFIAMEFLEGEPLDLRLPAAGLPLDRLLDWSIQLADALDAAHCKGIIHRDIKPENIFITQRGQVKVLDFGLAKLTRPEMQIETIGGTRDAPAAVNLTSPGATVGTIAYMSPEQARGEELDPRTDIFSLGVVIYQMATGQMPFVGPTSAVVFNAILERDPVSVLQWNSALPPKLDEIVAKALDKDRDLRYQSAADLRGDLKRLKRDSEPGRKTGLSASGSAAARAASSRQVDVAASSGTTSRTQPAATDSTWIPIKGQNKLQTGLIAGLAVVLVAAVSYGIYIFAGRSHAAPFQNISATKLTDAGDVLTAALSPDGQYILTMTRRNGLASLWLRNVPTNSNVQVQPAEDVYYNGVRFAPDGNYFYFVRSDPGNAELRFLYRAPLLGGVPQKLAADVDSNITFAPDGKRFAFMRYDNPEPGKYQLIVRPVQGEDRDEGVLASGSKSQAMYSPVWSPDGKTIVCNQVNVQGVLISLTAVDVNGGKSKVFFGSNLQPFEVQDWMPDGSGVIGVLHGMSSSFNQTQIAFVSYPRGKLSRITHDTNAYSYVTVASNRKSMTAVMSEGRWNVFLKPSSGDSAQGRVLTSAVADTNFTWTRDGFLISDQGSALNRINVTSGDKSLLATEEGSAVGNPYACPSGRYVLFDLGLRNGTADSNVWRMDATGGNMKQLTNGKTNNHSVCSADGRWVYFMDQQDETRLARVPIDGGTPQIVSNLPITESQFDVSPDGKLAAFATLEHSGEHQEMLAVVDTDTQNRSLKCDLHTYCDSKQVKFERPRSGLIRFSHDGKAVVYATRENGVDNLWSQPLDGSRGKQITNFTSEHIYDFHWSFDGKQLAMVRGHNDSDVVLIREQNH